MVFEEPYGKQVYKTFDFHIGGDASQTLKIDARCQLADARLMMLVFCAGFACVPRLVFFIKKQTLLVDSGCRRENH